MIEQYFFHIEKTISRFKFISGYSLNKKLINENFGIIEGQISSSFGILDFLEVVRISDTGKCLKKKYKYHFRNLKHELVYRYDNVPHHPGINTFPHYKHTDKGIFESHEPELFDVLKEIESY